MPIRTQRDLGAMIEHRLRLGDGDSLGRLDQAALGWLVLMKRHDYDIAQTETAAKELTKAAEYPVQGLVTSPEAQGFKRGKCLMLIIRNNLDGIAEYPSILAPVMGHCAFNMRGGHCTP